jgi:Protein of unknown function (DUF4239)
VQWIIAHTEIFFPLLLVILLLVVELGVRARHASPNLDAERQSLFESARDGLSVLLSFLLGFSLPMALPHYEQRSQLVVDEANAIGTVHQRAQMLPEPFRERILKSLREYVDTRIDFSQQANEKEILASVGKARKIQDEMWQESVSLVQQQPNAVTPLFVQALGQLSDLIESRLAAYEKRVPMAIWLVLLVMSALTCFVVGYSMKQRLVLAMLVVPLTVAIVLSLVSELDNPRTGFVNVGQQSMERLAAELQTETGAGR